MKNCLLTTATILLLISAVLTGGIAVHAAARVMDDGTIFDPVWYAAQYPESAKAAGSSTDTDALYRYYQLYGQGKGEKPYDEKSVSTAEAGQLKKASAKAKQKRSAGYGAYAAAWETITSGIYDTDAVKVWKTSYPISGATNRTLAEAVAQYEGNGYTVGFVLVDLTTGDAISYHAGSEIYSASVIKAPYLFSLLESGVKPTNDMYLAGNQSDNDAYRRVRNQYGNEVFAQWLQGTNVPQEQTKTRYIFTTPIDLCRMFYRGTGLILGNETNSDWARNTFTNSLNSAAALTLGQADAARDTVRSSNNTGSAEADKSSADAAQSASDAASSTSGAASQAILSETVYSKAGWIASGKGSRENSYTNAAIVNGSYPYIVAVMCNAPGSKGLEYTKTLMPVLDKIHDEMVNPATAVSASAASLEKFASKAVTAAEAATSKGG